MQQQDIIDYYVNQFAQVPPPYSFSDKRPEPLFPQDCVMNKHLRAVEMSQQSRQPPASAPSNDPESSHEPKGHVVRPRNDHGVPTETRKYPFYWESQPVGMIQTQLSNRGWRKPHFKHYSKRDTCQTIFKQKHYLK